MIDSMVSLPAPEVLHGHLPVGKARELKQRQAILAPHDDAQAGGRPDAAVTRER